MTRYFQNIWYAVRSIPASMAISFKVLREKPVTLQYPDEKWKLPERARAQLFMNVDDCIGCVKCARACPVDCIHIETVKAGKEEDLGKTSRDTPKRLHVLVFDIDMAKCCYCGLCTYPCPTECLTMTPKYEASTYGRYDLIYHFAAYDPEAAKEVVAKAKEREGEKFSIGVVPEHLESQFLEKHGTYFTPPARKVYPEPKPKPAPAPAATAVADKPAPPAPPEVAS